MPGVDSISDGADTASARLLLAIRYRSGAAAAPIPVATLSTLLASDNPRVRTLAVRDARARGRGDRAPAARARGRRLRLFRARGGRALVRADSAARVAARSRARFRIQCAHSSRGPAASRAPGHDLSRHGERDVSRLAVRRLRSRRLSRRRALPAHHLSRGQFGTRDRGRAAREPGLRAHGISRRLSEQLGRMVAHEHRDDGRLAAQGGDAQVHDGSRARVPLRVEQRRHGHLRLRIAVAAAILAPPSSPWVQGCSASPSPAAIVPSFPTSRTSRCSFCTGSATR